MNKLILLGTADSVFEVNYNQEETDFWATGTTFGAWNSDVKKIDLGFEIHPIEVMKKIAHENMIDYNKFDCPILVQDANDPIAKELIKKPITFPLQEVLDYGGVEFYTSTFCYMIVYAAFKGYKDVKLSKILLSSGGEYFLERPGIEYWIEKLTQRENINFHFDEDCELFASKVLYGYKQRPNIYKMKSFKKHLWAKLNNEIGFVEQLTARINKNLGALQAIAMMKSKEIDEKKLTELITNSNTEMMNDKKAAREHKEAYLQHFGGLQILDYLDER